MPYEKVGKNEPVCIADAVPFEIPENWEWVRLGNIFNIRSAMRIHQTDWKTSGVPFFRGRELVQLIKSGKVDFEIYLSRELYEKNKEKGGVPKKDDILITAVGTIGQTYIVKGTQEFYYKDAYILCLENIGHVLLPEYIKLAIDSPYCQTDIHKDAMATTVSQLTIIKANSLFIPIPPLSEQVRIVQKYNEIVPIITEYDKKERQLTIINGSFPESLKKSILQQAVMGKLVPQDPNDEPASLLLEKIRAEKDALIKAGKLKKDKHESIIYRRDNSHYEKIDDIERCIDEDLPFEIPSSWEWVRLGSICEIARGGSPRPIKAFITNRPDGINWIKIGDTDKGGKYINSTKERIIAEGVNKSRFVHAGDFLLTNSMSFGRPYILNIDGCIHDGWLVISNYQTIYNKDFLYYMLSSTFAYYQFCDVVSGAVVKNLNSDKVAASLFPVPPMIEQKRIVARISELMPHCDEL